VKSIECLFPYRVNRLTFLFLGALAFFISPVARGQELPSLVNEVVDSSKLIPLLPNAPSGWTADKAEGSTTDAGGFKLTTAHRDYKKGEADNAPFTSISILDCAGSPEYVETTTQAWKDSSSGQDGYTKPETISGNPAYESYENDSKRGSLSIMVAKRYLVQIEAQQQDASALQEWMKLMDLKKLSDVK
jgi:hypothetical protein